MTSRKAIEEFLSQKKLAVFGVSRSGKKFGNSVFKELGTKGYTLYGINSQVAQGTGSVYPNLQSLPEKVNGAVLIIPPSETEKAVRDIYEAEIQHVWMQQGSQSPAAVQFCKEKGINVIENECILMFAEPVKGAHGFHRWMKKLFRKLPK